MFFIYQIIFNETRNDNEKLFRIFVALAIAICIMPISISASENLSSSLYAYSNEDDGFEIYAKENVNIFMLSHYADTEFDDIELGKGITIFNQREDKKMLFPMWKGDEVVATFVVGEEDGEYFSVYSEAYVGQLNYLFKNTGSNPIYLFSNDNGIYAIINDRWYDLNKNGGDYFYSVIATIDKENIPIINAKEKLTFNPYIQTRIPTSYSKSFNIYHRQMGAYCYSYALGNILMNMGYISYTPEDIQGYMNYAEGASKSDLSNYLNSKGLSCNYNNYGYLSFDDVMSLIYNNNSYIYIGAKSNNRNASHAFVIYGYFNNGTTQLYNFWNPWYSYKQTMSAGNRITETETSETFTWNNGNLYNIR